MTKLEITKARLRAIRLGLGLTDEDVRVASGRSQKPFGHHASDWRGVHLKRHFKV